MHDIQNVTFKLGNHFQSHAFRTKNQIHVKNGISESLSFNSPLKYFQIYFIKLHGHVHNWILAFHSTVQ